jgi:hypothetical protein
MSNCKQHKVPMKLADGGGGYTVERCDQCDEESRQRMNGVIDRIEKDKRDAMIRQIADRYLKCSIYIFECPAFAVVDAVLRCADEAGFMLVRKT